MDAETPKVKTLSVLCDHCGAPLDVGEDSRYVTCAHCEAKLVVHHTGSAHWTAKLDSLVEKTDDISRELRVLRLERRLEAIDRGWRRRQEQMMTRGQHGERVRPTTGGALAVLAVGVVFFLSVGGGLGQWAIASPMLLMTCAAALLMISRASELEGEESRWLARRGKVRAEIAALRRRDEGAASAPPSVVKARARRR